MLPRLHNSELPAKLDVVVHQVAHMNPAPDSEGVSEPRPTCDCSVNERLHSTVMSAG